MTNLVLLEDSHAASLADNVHEVAVVELVRAKQELIVGQLIAALGVVAFKSDRVQVLLLELVQLFEAGLFWALAGR